MSTATAWRRRAERHALDDDGLAVLLSKAASKLGFQLVDRFDHWALMPHGKKEPAALGDLRFIARQIDRIASR